MRHDNNQTRHMTCGSSSSSSSSSNGPETDEDAHEDDEQERESRDRRRAFSSVYVGGDGEYTRLGRKSASGRTAASLRPFALQKSPARKYFGG